MIDHNSLFYPEFNSEKDSLIEVIKKNTSPLAIEDKIDAYFMLMLYNFNHNHRDSTQTLKYGDSLKMLIQNKQEGHFYQLYTQNAIEAIHHLNANRYGKAIEILNLTIEDANGKQISGTKTRVNDIEKGTYIFKFVNIFF